MWEKVGKFCDIADWLKLECKVTAGDGKSVGTVRDLAGGRVKEIMIAQTSSRTATRSRYAKAGPTTSITASWKRAR